jgi:hypothetical protein
MSERRENSVLVALRELRGIEDDRVKREQDEIRARADAERAAKEAAEQRMRAEEEARQLAEAERVRRAEDEKQARVREEQLRIEEAERRARVDGEMRLQEERMRLEIQSRVHHHKSPVKAIVGVAIALALIGGGVVYKIQAAHKEEMVAREREAKEQQERREKAAQIEFEKKIAAIKHEMDAKLTLAKSDAEREQIKAEANRKAAVAEDRAGKARNNKRGTGTSSDQPTRAAGLHVPGKREISDGVLDGL